MKLETFHYFFPERPRLGQIDTDLVAKLSDSPDWIGEPKYDGKRLMLHHLDGQFLFYGRHGDLLKYQPSPDLLRALADLQLSGYWLFDGELRDRKVKGVRDRVVLYDLYICEGELLLRMPFKERRGILDALFHYRGSYEEALDLAPQYRDDFRAVFERLIQNPEYEGLVLKNLNGKLQPGRTSGIDSSWMLKLRRPSGRYKF